MKKYQAESSRNFAEHKVQTSGNRNRAVHFNPFETEWGITEERR
jgi:hypothetical protein